MKRPSTRLSKPGPPVRPLKEKELGPFGEVSTSNPGSEVPRGAPEVAPNVSARERTMLTWETKWLRGAPATPNLSGVTKFEHHDVGTARQTQRPGKSKIMCFQGMQLSDRGVQLVSKGEVEPRDTKERPQGA